MFSIIAHCDSLLNYDQKNKYDFRQWNHSFHLDLPRLKKGQVKIITLALFVNPEYYSKAPLERGFRLLQRLYKLAASSAELKIIYNPRDLQEVWQSNKLGIIISMEGAAPIKDLATLRIFHRLGLKMLSLTWNKSNQFAGGVEEQSRGISFQGQQLVQELDKLKIIHDVSHLSLQSFWDLLELTPKPVIASHSNAYSLCPHPRNLRDEQLRALAARGGLIGLNFAPQFLNLEEKSDIQDVIAHINYIRDLIGIDHLCLGTDFDGIEVLPAGLADVSCLPKLENLLASEGYSQQEIQKIFYSNYFNFLLDYWGETDD